MSEYQRNERMHLPTVAKCHDLMAETQMLDNIKAHSILVSQVAIFIAQHLYNTGVPLSLPLIETSALLHDITKTRSLQTGEKHAATGAQLIRKLGYPEAALVIHQHVRLSCFSEHTLPSEPEIVNYADKRVLHDKIAPLADRMRYIEQRYGTNEKKRHRIKLMWKESERLEKKLFRFLPFTPDELPDFIQP